MRTSQQRSRDNPLRASMDDLTDRGSVASNDVSFHKARPSFGDGGGGSAKKGVSSARYAARGRGSLQAVSSVSQIQPECARLNPIGRSTSGRYASSVSSMDASYRKSREFPTSSFAASSRSGAGKDATTTIKGAGSFGGGHRGGGVGFGPPPSRASSMRKSIAIDPVSLAQARAHINSNLSSSTGGAGGPAPGNSTRTPRMSKDMSSGGAGAIAASAEALEAAQAALSTAQLEVRNLRVEKARLEEELDAAQRQVKFMQSSNEATASTSEIYQLMFRKELMGSMSRVEELKSTVEQQAQRLASAEAALPRYKNAAIEAELARDQLQEQVTKLRAQVDKLGTDLDEANAAVIAAQADETLTFHQISELEMDNQRLVQGAEDYCRALSSKDARIAELEAEMTKLKSEGVPVSSPVSGTVSGTAALEEELAQLRVVAAEVALLREVMTEAEERCGCAERRMAELLDEAANERTRAVKAEAEAAALLARSDNLAQQLRDAHAGVLKLQAAAADAQAQADQQAKALAAAQAAAADVAAARDKAITDAEELSALLTDKMSEVASLTVQVAQLKEALAAVPEAVPSSKPAPPSPVPRTPARPQRRSSSSGAEPGDADEVLLVGGTPRAANATPLPSDPRAAAALLARRDVQLETLRGNIAALEEALGEQTAHNRLLQEQVKINAVLREQIAALDAARLQAQGRAAEQEAARAAEEAARLETLAELEGLRAETADAAAETAAAAAQPKHRRGGVRGLLRVMVRATMTIGAGAAVAAVVVAAGQQNDEQGDARTPHIPAALQWARRRQPLSGSTSYPAASLGPAPSWHY